MRRINLLNAGRRLALALSSLLLLAMTQSGIVHAAGGSYAASDVLGQLTGGKCKS